jgi:hypothetical protein
LPADAEVPQSPAPGDARDTPGILGRNLDGLREAYTGQPLVPAAALFQCYQCDAYYYGASVEVIRTNNEGRCVACGQPAILPARTGERSFRWDTRRVTP